MVSICQVQNNRLSKNFPISLHPTDLLRFFSPQVPARRSKSSRPAYARVWYAPLRSLSSSVSCSSQPIRCCGAAWNRSRGHFCGLGPPPKGYRTRKRPRRQNSKDPHNRQLPTAAKKKTKKKTDQQMTVDQLKTPRTTYAQEFVSVTATHRLLQGQQDLANKEAAVRFRWTSNYTYQSLSNNLE